MGKKKLRMWKTASAIAIGMFAGLPAMTTVPSAMADTATIPTIDSPSPPPTRNYMGINLENASDYSQVQFADAMKTYRQWEPQGVYSMPWNTQVTSIEGSSVALSWSEEVVSNKNTGVYDVYDGNTKIADSVVGTTYTVQNVDFTKSHEFYVVVHGGWQSLDHFIMPALQVPNGSTPSTNVVKLQSDSGDLQLVQGATHQSVTYAVYDNHVGTQVTSGVTYATDNPAVATVNDTGVISGVSPGTANITATYNGMTVTTPVTVSNPQFLNAEGQPNGDADVMVWAGPAQMDGTYQLSFVGKVGSLRLNGGGAQLSNVNYDSSTNTTTATVKYNDAAGGDFLSIIFDGTGGQGVRDVHLWRPVSEGSTQSYAPGTLFTNQFLDMVKQFQAVRYMDWRATNWNADVNWSDRTLPDQNQSQSAPGYGWEGKGVAWEYVIQLANQTHTDAWINIPVNATDDYIKQLADLFKNGDTVNGVTYPGLDPSLKLYIEYSNEVWNFSFQQAHDDYNAAAAEVASGNSPLNFDGDTDGNDLMHRRVGERTFQISNIFRSAFGDAAMMTQVRPVIEDQYGDLNDTMHQALLMVDHLASQAGHSVNYYIWGGGSAGYYGPDSSANNLTTDNIWTSGDFSTNNWGKDYMWASEDWALRYGIHRDAYEATPDLSGSNVTAALATQAWNDPRMTQAVTDHQNAFTSWGGDLIMYFESGPGTGMGWTSGSWDDTNNAKMKAIAQLGSATPAPLNYGTQLPAQLSVTHSNLQYNMGGGTTTRQFPQNGWMDWSVQVNKAATYDISTDATGGGTQEILVDDIPVWTGATPMDAPVRVNLGAGLHAITVLSKDTGFQMGTVEVDEEGLPTMPKNVAISDRTDTTATLSWTASTDTGSSITGSNIYQDGKKIATDVPGTTYQVQNLDGSTYYSFAVTAVDQAGNESALSKAVVTGPPGNALPQAWAQTDIGAVGKPGDVTYANGLFTLTASGADVYGTTDQLHYVYQVLPADGTIEARIDSMTNTNPYAKAGVMIRDSLNAGANMAYLALTPSGTVQLGAGDTATSPGANNVWQTNGAASPYWVKLVRSGSTVTAFTSQDGVNWTQGNQLTFPSGTAYIGLATDSHDNNLVITSAFDYVYVQGGVAPPLTSAALSPNSANGQNGWYNQPVTLTLTASDQGGTIAKTEYSLDGGTTWQEYTAPVTFSQDGHYTIQYRSTNTIGVAEKTESVSFQIDSTAPSTTESVSPAQTDGQNGWYVHPVTISLSANDETSGVASTQYSLDGGQTWKVYSAPIVVSADGQYTVEYQSIDKAGNTESTHKVTIQLDESAPNLNISSPTATSYADSGDLTPRYTATDATSGTDNANTVATLDGKTLDNGSTVALYTLPLGQHQYVVTAMDNAGNKVTQTVSFTTTTSMTTLEALVTRFENAGSISKNVAGQLQRDLQKGDLGKFVKTVQQDTGTGVTSAAVQFLVRDANSLLGK